jgi:hypothetical protein
MRASWSARTAAAVLLLTLLAATAQGWSAPAVASCVTEGLRSPWAFEGVVSTVRSERRIATVRTYDGSTVEVRGGSPRAMTSVDRTFEPGGRYEFHPVNDSSPFEDNSCTATRLLSVGPVPAAAPGSSSNRPQTVALVAIVTVGLLALTGLVARRSRRRVHPAS